MEALNFLSVEQMQTLKDLGLEMKIIGNENYSLCIL